MRTETKEVTNSNMTDQEFFAYVEVKLGFAKFENWATTNWEDRMLRLYAIICEVRAIEREEISRQKMYEQQMLERRKDVHPV